VSFKRGEFVANQKINNTKIQKLTSQTKSTMPLAAFASPTLALMACVDGG
jgi:hypothetical protein